MLPNSVRAGVDLDAPALVVPWVPVQAVELVEGHQVDDLLDLLLREEVARHVEHQAEARGIVDRNARQRPGGRGIGLTAEEGGGAAAAADRLHGIGSRAATTQTVTPEAATTELVAPGFERSSTMKRKPRRPPGRR